MTAGCSKCGRVRQLRRGLCGACYEYRRSRDIVYGRWVSCFTDAAPVRAHVQGLLAAGMSRRQLCRAAGISRTALTGLLTGRAGRGVSRRVTRGVADRILAVTPPDAAAAHRVAAPGDRVCAVGTVRRLRALVALGYPQAQVCRRLGWSPANSTALFRGRRDFVTAATALRVAGLFDSLQLTPGPSVPARRRAVRLRWAPPLAWDEDAIDDPGAVPVVIGAPRMRFPQRYFELRELGYSDVQIPARLGFTRVSSLVRSLQRYDLPVSAQLASAAWDEKAAGRVS